MDNNGQYWTTIDNGAQCLSDAVFYIIISTIIIIIGTWFCRPEKEDHVARIGGGGYLANSGNA